MEEARFGWYKDVNSDEELWKNLDNLECTTDRKPDEGKIEDCVWLRLTKSKSNFY